MSSLKGQLSNVEGSVKSMKAAVVVGSVLTVACLAAVFGVTVLANEVSKEVKVSNGTLATKAGKSVLTTSTYTTTKVGQNIKSVSFQVEGAAVTSAVNAIVVQGATTTVICDDLIQVEESGDLKYGIREGSILESILGGETEKRNLNCPSCIAKVAAWAWKSMSAAAKARYGTFQTYFNRIAGWLEAIGAMALWDRLTGDKR